MPVIPFTLYVWAFALLTPVLTPVSGSVAATAATTSAGPGMQGVKWSVCGELHKRASDWCFTGRSFASPRTFSRPPSYIVFVEWSISLHQFIFLLLLSLFESF
jgi:hypothetical protein